jgi:hypothetical protein
MNEKNDNLIAELRSLTRADLAEVFYVAFKDREERSKERAEIVYEKLVLAEATWADEGGPPLLRVVCPSHQLLFGGDELTEVGDCQLCCADLCSAFKLAKCPICGAENELT